MEVFKFECNNDLISSLCMYGDIQVALINTITCVALLLYSTFIALDIH